MDSPQHHRAPHAMCSPEHVAPINLGLPLHAPHAAPGNDPFLAPPAPAFAPAPAPAPAFAPAPVVHNDPFLGPPAFAPVVYGGQQYNHLPAALAQQLAALPPIPVHIGRGHGNQAHPHPDGVPPPIFPPVIPPPILASAQGRGRGRGHGRGRGRGHAPAPAAMVC